MMMMEMKIKSDDNYYESSDYFPSRMAAKTLSEQINKTAFARR